MSAEELGVVIGLCRAAELLARRTSAEQGVMGRDGREVDKGERGKVRGMAVLIGYMIVLEQRLDRI
jgi:hypothetical protein